MTGQVRSIWYKMPLENYGMFYEAISGSTWNDGSFKGPDKMLICEWDNPE